MNPQGIPKNPDTSEASEKLEVSMEYTKVPENASSRRGYIQVLLRGVLRSKNIDSWDFSDFLDDTMEDLGLDEKEFEGAAFNKDRFSISLKGDRTLWFSLQEVQSFTARNILSPTQKKESEEKIANILHAIEAIYSKNDGLLWDGEINDEDIIKSTAFNIHWMDLRNKNLNELREELDMEKKQLFQVYEITWETHQKQEILKKELEHFGWIWWISEWGARYFSLSDTEIDTKVKGLLSTMWSTHEIFDYIRMINKQIRRNRKKSDMVNQVNGKLIEALYQFTFQRLKDENAPNKDFIECCKVVTGRWKATWNKDGFLYESLAMEEKMKDYQLGNEIIIHLMMKDGWVFESMKQEFSIEDPEVDTAETPSSIISSSMATLRELWKKMPEPKSAEQLLVDIRLPDVQSIEGEYNDLSFSEKIDLWALVRIIDVIETTGYEEVVNNPQKFQEKLINSSKDAYKDLNKDLSDHFDGTNVNLSMWQGWLSFLNMNFWGMEAADLGLSGEFWEVFNLYQDMNGNSWFLDWSDEMQDFLSPSLAGMATLTASFIIFGIAVASLPATVTVWSVMLAWAAAWAWVWLISSVLWSQWYDTKWEAITDTASIMTADAALWAITFWLWNKFVWRQFITDAAWNVLKNEAWQAMRHTLKTIPLLSKTGLKEMFIFWWSEMAANMWFVAPFISSPLKEKVFTWNHFDTKDYRYENWKRIVRKPEENIFDEDIYWLIK